MRTHDIVSRGTASKVVLYITLVIIIFAIVLVFSS